MPSRKRPADSVMSFAVCAGSPGVTSPFTATKYPKPASTAISRSATPAVSAASRMDRFGSVPVARSTAAFEVMVCSLGRDCWFMQTVTGAGWDPVEARWSHGREGSWSGRDRTVGGCREAHSSDAEGAISHPTDGSGPCCGSDSSVGSAPSPTLVCRWTSVRRSVRPARGAGPVGRFGRSGQPAGGAGLGCRVTADGGEDPAVLCRPAPLRVGRRCDRANRRRVSIGGAGRRGGRGPLPPAARFGQCRGGADGVDGNTAGRIGRTWPHPDRGRTGRAVAGRGGDRPCPSGADRRAHGDRSVDRTHRGLSVPGGAVGAADDRPVPGGPAGRRPGRVPARPRAPGGTARGGTRCPAAGVGVADPRS